MPVESPALQYRIQSNQDNWCSKFGALGITIRDLTGLAKNNELLPFVGRQKEIDWLLRRLSCCFRPNTLIVGQSGVGKTALVEGLAYASFLSENSFIRNLNFVEVSTGDLMAETAYRGDLEKKILRLMNLIQSDGTLVLFIDEAHTLAMTGDVQGGGIDVINLMKSYLSSGKVRVILATTCEESIHIVSDKAFMRRFSLLQLKPLSHEEQFLALKKKAQYLENYYSLNIDADVLASIQCEFLSIDSNLDQALDFLDVLCAQSFLSNGKTVKKSAMEVVKQSNNEMRGELLWK